MSAIREKIIEDVFAEIGRAEEKFHGFPFDPIHAAAILAEENGELQQACLQWTYENGDINNVRKEAIQTAAMSLRFLFNLEFMKPRKSEKCAD